MILVEKTGNESLIAQFQYIRSVVDALQVEIDRLSEVHTQLKMTIAGLRELKSGDEILVSQGSGIFLRSTIIKDDPVLISVGANVYIEKPKEEAIQYLKKQVERIEVLSRNYRSQLLRYLQYLEVLRGKLEESAQKSSG